MIKRATRRVGFLFTIEKRDFHSIHLTTESVLDMSTFFENWYIRIGRVLFFNPKYPIACEFGVCDTRGGKSNGYKRSICIDMSHCILLRIVEHEMRGLELSFVRSVALQWGKERKKNGLKESFNSLLCVSISCILVVDGAMKSILNGA